MKELVLLHGEIAYVDYEDFDRIKDYKWFYEARPNTVYVARWCPILKRLIRLHREILNAPKGITVDHIDGNGLNNTKANLRLATTSQNGANTKSRARNKSGYKGVSRHQKDKWQVHLKCGNKKLYLGLFTDLKEAAKAYNIAALEHFGEFAKLNEIKD